MLSQISFAQRVKYTDSSIQIQIKVLVRSDIHPNDGGLTRLAQRMNLAKIAGQIMPCPGTDEEQPLGVAGGPTSRAGGVFPDLTLV